MKKWPSIILSALLLPAVSSAFDTDMDGSADHPELPRVTGSNIVGYEYLDYGAGRFASGLDGKEYVMAEPEGKTTRIVYVGRNTQSSLQLFRNFETAFGRMGEFTEIYSCKPAECTRPSIGRFVVWQAGHEFPSLLSPTYGFVAPSTYKEPMYIYGTVQKGDATYHVSVYTATVLSATPEKIRNRPVAHVEIVEVEEFEPTLDIVDAEAVSMQLETKGRIALYGILFDTDSAVLQASSAGAVTEVAKSLKTNPSMSVYVVGHTDNEGNYTYNRDLSQQRAASVVRELVDTHGIGADRLLAVGVGPVAPKGNNDNEGGRAVNRRVEIVRR